MKALNRLFKTGVPVWLRIVIVLVCLFIIVNLLLSLSMALISALNLDNFFDGYDSERNLLIEAVLLFLSATATVYLVRRTIDRQSFASLGISIVGQRRSVLVALAAVAIILGLGTAFLVALNAIEVGWNEFSFSNQIMLLIMFLLVGCYEELLFRGYILNNLMTVTNKYIALLISAILFALFHLANDSITLLSTVNLVLAGVLLGVPYILTKNLWFPILFHSFWNYVQGGILGYKVSGLSLNSLFYVTPLDSSVLSGGNFGFEGSLVCTILLVGAIVLFVRMHVPQYLEMKKIR